jgi:hypothetical protein
VFDSRSNSVVAETNTTRSAGENLRPTEKAASIH